MIDTLTHLRVRSGAAALVTALALFAAGRPAAGGDMLQLTVLDDATGEPLRGFQASIVDAARRVVRGKVEKGTYGGPRQEGDSLYVYRRGYDLGVLPLGAETRVTVRLRRAAGTATVVMHDPATVAAGWTANVSTRPPERWDELPFDDSEDVRCDGDRLVVPVPEGIRTTIFPDVGDPAVVVWPMGIWMKAGVTYKVQVDRGRDLEVLRAEGVALDRPLVYCLPDVLWDPATDRRRVDAWRWNLNRPAWLREQILGRGATLRLCPDVPFHMFAFARRVPVYRYVAREDAALDLRGPFPLRTVSARPVIDGQVLAAGGMLAAGRLHLDALSMMDDLEGFLDGHYHVAGPADEAWPEVRLPAAPWLTAWDPLRGIAHLRWEEGVAPTGRYGPGAVDVVVAPGIAAAGKAAVFPLWSGTGALHSTPPLRSLTRPVPESGRLRFPGLPLGTYGASLQVVLRAGRTGEEVRTERWTEVHLTRARPTAEIRLPLR